MQHITTLMGATCCVHFTTLLWGVPTCWVLLAQIWQFDNGQIFHAIFVIAGCCSCLARSVQQCCTQACTPVRLNFKFQYPTCCNRVAKYKQHVVPGTNVGISICCIQMLRSFCRRWQMPGRQCWDMLFWDVAIIKFWLGLKNNTEHYILDFKL